MYQEYTRHLISRQHALRRSARRRNLAFSLKQRDITTLYAEFPACPECGVWFVLVHSNDAYPTIDRVNADVGYVQGNVQLMCGKCNRKKDRDEKRYTPKSSWHFAAADLAYPQLILDLT